MELNNEKDKIDKKRELISRDLNELLKLLIIFMVIAGIFGYIGYLYSSENNQDIAHGIIFFSLYPLLIGIIKILNIDNTITYIISTIAYFYCTTFIPTIVGAIILLIIVAIFVSIFIYIETKDRTKEIDKIYNSSRNKNSINNLSLKAEDILKRIEKNTDNNVIENTTSSFDSEEDEIYECEMCFKQITYEEYELYDGMCEECFLDVHTDEHGHFNQ